MNRALRYLALLTIFLNATSVAEPSWQRYVDPETSLRVDIPVGIFGQDAGVPDSGHGRKLVTKDGRANLTVQTFANERSDTPAAFLASKRPPPGIIYRRVTSKFFVVSSVKNSTIWYNRCNFSRRVAYCVLINYPAGEKSQWDGVVNRISRSLTL